MSYAVFFDFSTGLASPIQVPKGTLVTILAHVGQVEKALCLIPVKPEVGERRWDITRKSFQGIEDELLCETVERHNRWVRRLYDQISEWSEKPPREGEEITPEAAAKFWHALRRLTVPPARWTSDYYRARMDSLYEVMRGRDSEGVSLDTKALTPKQASAAIRLFSEFLDTNDLRLEVPNGHDFLASSYDGGYDWCEKCGPMISEDARCCRRRECPLREEED